MPHIYFKQPNNKYGIWSSIVDAPIDQNLTKTQLKECAQLTELEFQYYVYDSLDDALDEGDIECCLFNGNMTRDELLKYFKDIKYSGPLVNYAVNLNLNDNDEEEPIIQPPLKKPYKVIVEGITHDNCITLRIKDTPCPQFSVRCNDFAQFLQVGQEIDLELESECDIADMLNTQPEEALSFIEKENDKDL